MYYLFVYIYFLDPFVKVYLLLNGKRIKKKKTACRKSCNNPVWNEAITFNLSSSVLNNSAVEVINFSTSDKYIDQRLHYLMCDIK